MTLPGLCNTSHLCLSLATQGYIYYCKHNTSESQIELSVIKLHCGLGRHAWNKSDAVSDSAAVILIVCCYSDSANLVLI